MDRTRKLYFALSSVIFVLAIIAFLYHLQTLGVIFLIVGFTCIMVGEICL